MNGPPTEIIVRHVIEYQSPPHHQSPPGYPPTLYPPPPPAIGGGGLYGPSWPPGYGVAPRTNWWDLLKGIALIAILIWVFT